MEQALETTARAALIMNSIKLVLLLLVGCALVVSCAVVLSGADLAGVRTVYVLPMSHGMDQYLANTLTTEHVFAIVTDPKRADAVLTDHIGAGLEEKLDTMLAVPPPEKPEPKAGGKGDAKDTPAFLAETANKLENPASASSVGHNKGTVFLVDTKSRQVVWSIYELPRDATSKELDRIASAIVSRLKKDLGLGVGKK
jgi:hypothetical protein